MSRAERRFRVKDLLFDGGDYQIALAEDVLMDDKLVCVKTVAYDPARSDEKKYVGLRRKALHDELRFLSLPVHLLPEPLDWIQIEESEVALPREPLLVYEYVHGQTLYDLIVEKHPEGIAHTRALRMIRELCRFLAELHRRKWVFRNLDPRHVIVGFDDVLHMVGCGNAMQMNVAPNETRAAIDSPYAAPEIRGERSGKFLRPAADAYSLGALLSFMLTGEEPRVSVENPLSKVAYDRLSAYEPPGLSLLVARCMQPLAKKRFGRMETLLPHTTPTTLPRPTDDGFGLLQLPAPWVGAEPPDAGRAARSKLSPGPLISVEEQPKELEPATPRKVPPALIAAVVLIAVLVALGVGFLL